MEWFSEWWVGLAFVEQILYCIAIPATIILLIQTILLIVGFGSAGEGINPSDTSGLEGFDGDFDISDGGADSITEGLSGEGLDSMDGSAPNEMGAMSLFTMQGIISFLCIFSWSGIVLAGTLHILIALLIAFVLGFLAMFGVAKIIQLSTRLVQNGTLNMKILLGETGTVYIPVPANNSGHGKVNIQLAERFIECDAVSESDTYLPTNTTVRVVDILSGNILVVERLE